MPLSPMLAASLTLHAPTIFLDESGVSYFEWLSNSIFVSCIVSAFIIWFCRKATKNLTSIPGPTQNFFEAVVQSLYDLIESIVGSHMVARVFSLLATIFIFIVVSNWFGLLPGVGSIGWGNPGDGFLSVTNVEAPLLRPATADLNMTLAMASIFMVFWLYWSISEVGIRSFLDHLFGVKGGLTGIMAILLVPIFLFVGVIEVVSIAFRPVSLSLRLFGNIFAGENLLTTMITLGKQLGLPEWIAYIMSVTIPLPFYFLELLVGLLQATVFMLLCAVYIQLSTSHEEGEEH
jgi:F-type H+-transporting ATPase subunit a